MLMITGPTSGVGLSLVRHLSARLPILAVARNLPAAEKLFADLDNVVCAHADLDDIAALPGVMAGILADHDPVTHLINNAGILEAGGTAELAADKLEASFRVNALAPWLISRAVLPGMVEAGFGRIVNLTSGAPLNCFPGFGAYSASKAALNALTLTMAREYEDQDIRINLMSPGPVRSNMAPDAPMDPDVCHSTMDFLLDLPAHGPTGRFFWLGYELPLFPDLDGVQWLEGKAADRFPRVVP